MDGALKHNPPYPLVAEESTENVKLRWILVYFGQKFIHRLDTVFA